MSGKKISVVFTKRVEDRDKTGKKEVIAAGTEAELTAAQYKKLEGAVRRVDVKKPVAKSDPAPSIPPVTGEGGDDESGAGTDDESGEGAGGEPGTGDGESGGA